MNITKLPESPLLRTVTLENSLKELKKDYFFINSNSIGIQILDHTFVSIAAKRHSYFVRVDVFSLPAGGHFYYKEIDQDHGNGLLWELVSLEILDRSFIPRLKKEL